MDDFATLLNQLFERVHLTRAQMRSILLAMRDGQLSEARISAVLVALRMKGETADELAAAAEILRETMIPMPAIEGDIVDTCGTGGHGKGTFNISTAAAIVTAACGTRVVKHGNRAVSGLTGSADVLEALGVRIGTTPESCVRQLNLAGMTFCFAPLYHPSWKPVGDVRRQLKVRTMFNALGPLVNPARAAFQVIGVGPDAWLDPLTRALHQLGTTRSYLVRGQDGLGEVTLTTATEVREVSAAGIHTHRWTPDDFGLPRCKLSDLTASDAESSAAIVTSILNGSAGPRRDVVVANAAAALVACGKSRTLREAVGKAEEAIDNGSARRVLELLRLPT